MKLGRKKKGIKICIWNIRNYFFFTFACLAFIEY